jgi:hypothetical protein
MGCGAPKEGTRWEGTGFSDLEESAVPDLVAGLSPISGEGAGLVEGITQVDHQTKVQGMSKLLL